MSEQQNHTDQNQQERPMSQKTNVAIIGLFGGFFFSAFAYLAYYFHFMEVKPNFLISGWVSARLSDGWAGFILTVLLYGVLSIAVAFLYYFLLRKKDRLFVSIVFGAVVWGFVHFALPPLFPDMPRVRELDLNTFVTTVCLYLVYGAFIGVSISYDETERRMKQELEEPSPEVKS